MKRFAVIPGLLVIGCTLSMLGTWLLGATIDISSFQHDLPQTHSLQVFFSEPWSSTQRQAFGSTSLRSSWLHGAACSELTCHPGERCELCRQSVQSIRVSGSVPEWSDLRQPLPMEITSLYEEARGWPCLMKVTVWRGRHVPVDEYLANPVKSKPHRQYLWRGLAINSVFYGAVVFALAFGMMGLRRSIRRRVDSRSSSHIDNP